MWLNKYSLEKKLSSTSKGHALLFFRLFVYLAPDLDSEKV